MRSGDAQQGSECGMPGAPAIEAENKLIEVGLEVLAAQPMIDAQGPDLEVGKDPVDPGQHDVSGHLADDMGIMGDASSTGIPGPTIGLGGGTGGEVDGDKAMQAGGRIIGDLAEPDAARAAAAILDLDGSDHQHFALMTFTRGASGYLLKKNSGERLGETLRSALRGEPALSRSLVPHLVGEIRRGSSRRLVLPEGTVTLTAREWEVGELMREGRSTAEMAERLGVSPVTVRRHVSLLLRKLGVESRHAAVETLRAYSR